MGLKKEISFFGVFSIASGAMISSGLFILPGIVFAMVGSGVSIAYLLAGILVLMGVTNIIELATAMPKSGGDYFFINKTLGPMFGTVSGLLGWMALSLKSAFAIFGIAEVIFVYWGVEPALSGIILCGFFVLLNIVGVKEAAIFQASMVAGLLLLLVVFVFSGSFALEPGRFSFEFSPEKMGGIFAAAGFVFISFGGLLKVANISEEVKDPKRNIPLGMLWSTVVVVLLYTMVTVVLTGTLEPSVFRDSLTPVADSAKVIMGDVGYVMIMIASLLAFFTTANAGIMAASRYPMALSRDQLLPDWLSRVNPKFETPIASILITGLLISLSLLLDLEILIKSASTMILVSYILTALCVVILRESQIANYKPSFKAPFYPWLQLICIVIFSFFIIDMGLAAIELSLGFVFFSFCIFIFFGRRNQNREFALLHLMKRLIDSRLQDGGLLEDELREVLVHRDEIEQDYFDHLVKDAQFLDMESHQDYKALLQRVHKELSVTENFPKRDEFVSAFLSHQEESSAAVTNFFAVAHHDFGKELPLLLVVVRNKDGVFFSEERDNVKAVFLMVGHCRSKMSYMNVIASISKLIYHKNFRRKWLKIPKISKLKSLMVLSSRKRFHGNESPQRRHTD
jgi:amino acid transporter/mannitol/fructose-specific phosphotransferase system IIA component (Ntr-type)